MSTDARGVARAGINDPDARRSAPPGSNPYSAAIIQPGTVGLDLSYKF